VLETFLSALFRGSPFEQGLVEELFFVFSDEAKILCFLDALLVAFLFILFELFDLSLGYISNLMNHVVVLLDDVLRLAD